MSSTGVLVRDVMTQDVKTVRLESSVMEAVQKMRKFSIGSVVVLSDGRPVGIITEQDILRNIDVNSPPFDVLKARQIMSSNLIHVSPETSVEEAAGMMSARKIKKLPVIDGKKLVGILTVTDIALNAPQLLGSLRDILWASRS